MRSSLRLGRLRRRLVRRFRFSQMPPNLTFFGSVQSIIRPSIAALTSDQEVIAYQVAQSRLDIRNRAANPLLQEPPFRDSFHGVPRLRVLHEVVEYLVSQRTT